MRDYKKETEERVSWIKEILNESKAKGIIFGNSGGKDSVLVGILCSMATENLEGVIMPCGSKQNYESDKSHAILIADKFNIRTSIVDLTEVRNTLLDEMKKVDNITDLAKSNINPRLRMTTLYCLGQTKGYLVAGTGNKSENFMGYFTKWGDGAYDFNPIADLTTTEVFEFLKYLDCPKEIIEKSPSAGLFEGQTDEKEMGVTYKAIDEYINNGTGTREDIEIIEKYNNNSRHKRTLPMKFSE